MCLGAIYWARPRAVFFSATRDDAAEAGFDDAFIYDELALPPGARTLPMRRVVHPEAQGAVRRLGGEAGPRRVLTAQQPAAGALRTCRLHSSTLPGGRACCRASQGGFGSPRAMSLTWSFAIPTSRERSSMIRHPASPPPAFLHALSSTRLTRAR